MQVPSTVLSSLQTPLNRYGAQGVGLGFVVFVSAQIGQAMNRPQLLSSLKVLCPVPPGAVSCCFRKGHLFKAVPKAFVYIVELLLHLHK